MNRESFRELKQDKDYRNWLIEVKSKIRHVQLKAAVSVNRELLTFYWDLGEDIVNRQKTSNWGGRVLKTVKCRSDI